MVGGFHCGGQSFRGGGAGRAAVEVRHRQGPVDRDDLGGGQAGGELGGSGGLVQSRGQFPFGGLVELEQARHQRRRAAEKPVEVEHLGEIGEAGERVVGAEALDEVGVECDQRRLVGGASADDTGRLVFMVGEATGTLIYLRNLYLIWRKYRAVVRADL